ncbi:mechanosensitive ion channel family protein [Phytohabitans sp. ZYX-F-186]|uniref:Mechanosensitive ion channel family protein n=1 Tax=Phytohabitans maris TaxID=3071409 RepID=A0ABU0ZRG4_9ACTN|nr:mechanosensitive ion channel family protein [Phytohabitans sp. ZYX-F-186]MDQ7909596.1 mechanosensitive ion channel family protein [Phytohabitans sp. ZYX-F-186]
MIAALLAAPTPDPTPTVSVDCREDAFCKQVYDLTGNAWLSESSFWIFIKPLRIILILLVAFLIRWIAQRMIKRLVRTSTRTSVPTILRPLRERIPSAPSASDQSAVMPERRRQRAEAIGSVLRSSVTAVVFSIAVLLILSELNFNLAPLLASAGIAGVALGFGAQSLVKDVISGVFMLLEDQYGVGDTVDLGEATGIVEAVGLRITTVRDGRGVLWYIRNGEIIRVGNKSQGWAMVIVDMPIGFAGVEEATSVMRAAAAEVAEDPDLAGHFVDPPDVLGVEQITVDGAVIRTIAKTTADGQFDVGRELRRRLTEALESSGITARIAATRMYPRPSTPNGEGETRGGAT